MKVKNPGAELSISQGAKAHPFVEKESTPQVTEEPAVTQSTSSTVLNVVELSRRLLDGMGEIWMEIRQLEQSINPPPNYDQFSTRNQ